RNKHAIHTESKLTVGTWSHIAASFNGSSGLMSLSYDGVSKDKTYSSTVISGSTSPWSLGASHFSGSNENHWEGEVSEFRVYSRALSNAELNACYQATNTKYP